MARILGKIEAHWGVFKFNADATRCAEEIRAGLSDTFTSQELVELAKNPSTAQHMITHHLVSILERSSNSMNADGCSEDNY